MVSTNTLKIRLKMLLYHALSQRLKKCHKKYIESKKDKNFNKPKLKNILELIAI